MGFLCDASMKGVVEIHFPIGQRPLGILGEFSIAGRFRVMTYEIPGDWGSKEHPKDGMIMEYLQFGVL